MEVEAPAVGEGTELAVDSSVFVHNGGNKSANVVGDVSVFEALLAWAPSWIGFDLC